MEPETIKKLNLFHKRIGRLKENTDFFQSVTLNLNFEQGSGSRVALKGPDAKTIKATLVDFRPFTLNDEPVSFNHICNLVEKSVDELELKNKVREARDVWGKLLQRKQGSPSIGGMKMQIDSTELLSEENFEIWMNTDYFHIGDDKERNLLERMEQTPFGQLSHFAFIDLVQRMCGILFWFDKQVIDPLINQSHE
jgi:hypothetical protein